MTGSIQGLAQQLSAAGVRRAVMVDDTFDPPTRTEISDDDLADFWQRVRPQQDALDELMKYGEFDEPDQIDDGVIAKLWSERERVGALRPFLEQLFRERIAAFDELKRIEENLKRLGLEISKVGAGEEIPLEVDLVFVDYMLEPPHSRAAPGDKATNKVRSLLSKAEKKKPFVVLMSSLSSNRVHQEQFLERSELIGGLFAFIPKEEAKEPERLFVRLGSWGIGSHQHHELQGFVTEVVNAIDDVAATFKKTIRSLRVQDYAFIQQVSLNEEGHPLGDYMLWLFEASLGYELLSHSKVREQRANVDRMRFDEFLPFENSPSARVAQLYEKALFEPVEPVGVHPFDDQGSIPLLRFGDVFARDASSEVFLVINAPCDLMFSPGSKREAKSDQPVYLVPGKLIPLTEPESTKTGWDVETEFVLYGGKPYRIRWQPKMAQSKPLGRIRRHLKRCKYELQFRLRLPYALKVQQMFANSLTRIGMPVPPPLHTHGDVQVFIRSDKKGQVRQIGHVIARGAFLFREGEKNQFRLTSDCAIDILNILDQEATAMERGRNSPGPGLQGGPKPALEADYEKLRQCINDHELWLSALTKTWPVPALNKRSTVLKAGSVSAIRYRNPQNISLPSERIAINILSHADSEDVGEIPLPANAERDA